METPQPQPETMCARFSRTYIWLCSPCCDLGPEVFCKYLPHPHSRFTLFNDGGQAICLAISALDMLRRVPENPNLARDVNLHAAAKLVLSVYTFICFSLGLWVLVHHRPRAAKRSAKLQIPEMVKVLVAAGVSDLNDMIKVIELLMEINESMGEQTPWQIGAWEAVMHPLVKLPCVCIAIPYVIWRKVDLSSTS